MCLDIGRNYWNLNEKHVKLTDFFVWSLVRRYPARSGAGLPTLWGQTRKPAQPIRTQGCWKRNMQVQSQPSFVSFFRFHLKSSPIGQFTVGCRHFPRGAVFVSTKERALLRASNGNGRKAPPIRCLAHDCRCHLSQSGARKPSSGLNSLLFVNRFAARAREEATAAVNVSINLGNLFEITFSHDMANAGHVPDRWAGRCARGGAAGCFARPSRAVRTEWQWRNVKKLLRLCGRAAY